MLSNKRLEKIAKMEEILNESNNFLREAEALLAKWNEMLPQIKSLEKYYFSDDWRADFEAYENGKISKDQPCGVLSEDAAYDVIGAQHGLAIEYLKIITKILDQQA